MLVTLAEMKAFLGIQPSVLTYDSFLNEQITLISAAIEAYCKRIFSSGSYIQTIYIDDLMALNVNNLSELYLASYPLTSVTYVREFADEAAVTDNLYTAVTDFRVHNPTGKLTKNLGVCWGRGGFFGYGNIVKVSFSSGFSTVPVIIQSVVKDIVQERYNKKRSGIDLNFGSNVQSINIPGTVTVQYDFSLDANQRKSPFGNILGDNLNLLDYYRSHTAVAGTVERINYVV